MYQNRLVKIGAMFFVCLVLAYEAVGFFGPRVRARREAAIDCAMGYAYVGATCSGGSIYAGVFGGERYMVTPGGCAQEPSGSNTSAPVADFDGSCPGTADVTTKVWRSFALNYDIPNAETIAGAATASTNRGDVDSAAIVSILDDSDGGLHPAARYCDHLVFGGFTDWYLPSKSELAYLYCKTKTSGGVSYPQEDPNCATYGYGAGSNVLSNFVTGNYFSSSEISSSSAWWSRFSDGLQSSASKATSTHYLRCIRRVGPSFIGSVSGPSGYSGDLIVTGFDVNYVGVPEAYSQTITIKNNGDKEATGVTTSVSSGFNIVGGTCAPGSALAVGDTCTVEVIGVSTDRWENSVFNGVLTLSDSGKSSRISLQGVNTNFPDPCYRAGAPIGSLCNNGAILGGVFSGEDIMIAPAGCGYEPSGALGTYPAGEFTPTCSGADAMTKRWNESGSTSADLPGVETVSSSASASTVLGLVNTQEISLVTSLALGGYHPAARYCDRLEFGGFQDWYLPSKSELATISCRTKKVGSGTMPQDDLNCATAGYGTTTGQIRGFNLLGSYLTSTEQTAANIWRVLFSTNGYNSYAKSSADLVRCIRRKGPHLVASPPAPGDFSVDAVISNIDVDYTGSPESTAVTVTVRNQGDLSAAGVTASVTLGFEITGGTCSPVGALLPGQTCTVLIRGTSAERWYNGAITGTLTLQGNDRISYVGLSGTSINLPDPCTRPSRPIGVKCNDGTHYAGEYGGNTYYVTPPGCGYESGGSSTTAPSSNFTPSCSGTTDTILKSFKASSGVNYNLPSVEDIDSPNPSVALGDYNTAQFAAITLDAEGGPQPAARYCYYLNYGGHTDWYLPAKSELAFILCRSKTTIGSFPAEDPGCVGFGLGSTDLIMPGGLQSVVPGFFAGYYYSSTEGASTRIHVTTGGLAQGAVLTRNSAYGVRCVRRQ